MDINRHYSQLLLYSEHLCHNSSLSGGDLINEAYLLLHDKKDVTIELYKKNIKNIFLRQTRDIKSESSIIKETQRICSKCKENKDVSEFYSRATGGHFIKNQLCVICKKCIMRYKSTTEFKKKRNKYLKSPNQRENNTKRVKKFLSKNREQWNKYIRERYKKYGRKGRTPQRRSLN